MSMLNFCDYLNIIITSISFIDFLVFTSLFVVYLCVIQYKAIEWKTKIGSFIILLCFLAFKIIHIPVFLSTIIIINVELQYTSVILLSLTWVNIALAFFPFVTAITSIILNYLSKDDKINNVDDHKYDKINIIIPIYNEDPNSLWNSVESVDKLEYNLENIHLYLSFDDDKYSDAYNYVMSKLGNVIGANEYRHDCVRESGLKISICKFSHGGKKSAQQGAYNMIKTDYKDDELKNSKLFLMDSDIQLKSDCMWNFIKYMKEYNKTCLTGMITCKTSSNNKFLAYYQDIEYISGQIFWRNLESFCGATSCLPGAFTILNWESFDEISHEYFSKKDYNDIFDYQRFHLGEDRYLTHLLMIKNVGKIGFCERSRCKTDPPLSLMNLLKQRKRWFLGHISNDTWMLSSPVLWYKYPLLTLFNFFNNSRNTSIYVYLLYLVLFLNKDISFFIWFMYILLPILLNWLFIMYYAFILKRKMNIFFYICIIICQPILNMLYMYYTIYNIRINSWGGARVDKSHAINIDEEKENNNNVIVILNE